MNPLADGLHAPAPGRLVSVVTYLEMTSPGPPRPEPAAASGWLRFEPTPSVAWYRALFIRLGSDWLWTSRLAMAEPALAALLADPGIEVHVLERDGEDLGLLELDFRQAGSCEIVFFAVDASLQGQGAGRWLMNRALALAWRRPIDRLWLHTCTLDHPQALDFYRRTGFRPFLRKVEVFPDPRLIGLLPPDAAPRTPIL